MAERPTPVSIAICTVIALHSDPSSPIHDGSNAEGIGEHISKVIKHVILHDGNTTSANILSSPSIRNGNESMPLHIFLDLIAGQNNQYHHVSKFLLADLYQTVSSIDSIIDLFSVLRATVAKGVIDGDSAHGIYVRKRCLGFDQLGFESVGRFWEACVGYIEVFSERDDIIDDQKLDSLFPCPSDEGHETSDRKMNAGVENRIAESSGGRSSWPLAPSQISRTMMQQCRELDQQIDTVDFDERESQLQEILSENPELTLAHFLRFLNCANHRERIGAHEHFHRYFDYAMIQERKHRLAMPNLPEDSNANNNTNANNPNHPNGSGNDASAMQGNKQRKNVVQYVTIVLAALFHKLGNDEMAQMATQEAIKVAQQSGDGACLAYALGWLNTTSFNDEEDGSDQTRLLERASVRGGEFNLGSLGAGTSLQRAIHHITTRARNNHSQTFPSERMATGFHLSQAWQSIASASATSTTVMNAIGNTIYLNDVPTSLASLYEEGNTSQVFGRQKLVGAGLWKSVGRQNLSYATNQVSMHCHDEQLSNNDLASVTSEIASSVLYGTGSDRSYCRDETPHNLQSLSERLELLRSKTKKSSNAKGASVNLYAVALNKIQEAEEQSSNCSSTDWFHASAQIRHEALAREGNVHNAEAFEILLESAIIPGGNEEAAIQSLGHSCLLLCQKEKFGEANSLIASTILPLCEKHGLHYFRCYFLLKQAMIYLASSPDNPTNALPSLLDCLALSEEQSVDPIHAAALSLLSRVFLEMGNLDRAKATMKAVLPILLKHGHIYFQGQAWLTLAKCSLAEAKGFGKDNDECKDHTPLLLRALSELQRAAIAFENIKDTSPLREVYYLISQVCNAIPDHDDIRDKAARSFIGLNKARVSSLKPTWHDALSDILNYRREKINK